jgi:methyl-accepting chemotaxis protein
MTRCGSAVRQYLAETDPDGPEISWIEDEHSTSILDGIPTNALLADRDMRVRYANAAALNALNAVAAYLPVKIGAVIGERVGVVFGIQEGTQSVPSESEDLPYRVRVQLGPEVLNLLVSAIHDRDHTYAGSLVTFEVVTEAERAAAENAVWKGVCRKTAMSWLFIDPDGVIRYVNDAMTSVVQKLERLLPCRADQLLGQSVEVLPEHSCTILTDRRYLPYAVRIHAGDEFVDVTAVRIDDDSNNMLGTLVSWQLVTEQVAEQQHQRQQTRNLRVVLDRVSDTAARLGGASEELAASSEQMNAGADVTSAQADAVSAAAEQVSANVQTVAASTVEMTSSISDIARHAGDAAGIAAEADRAARRTNDAVARLGDSTAEISKVIEVIDAVARQTNMLALNAMIESARAGEAGKGFAVVASEVKELARATTHATEDITRRVDAIRSGTQGAIDGIAEISGVIQRINEISKTIARAVDEQSATTDQMSRNVSEAAKGSAGIAHNISALAQGTQVTTAAAGDIGGAAAEISQMAAGLEQVVAQYMASGFKTLLAQFNVDFDEAIRVHGAWRQKLAAYSGNPDGSLNPALVGVDNRCDLGKWLYGEEQRFAGKSDYSELVQAHARFHKAAAALVRRIDAGADVRGELAPGAANEFNRCSSQVVGLIEKMKLQEKTGAAGAA